MISIGNESQSEGDTGNRTYTFELTLANPSSQTVTVDWATQDGTALAPADYVAASGTVTFGPGVTTQTVVVQVKGDVVFEPDETFSIVLSDPTNATIGDGTGTGTIDDDDLQPTISISDESAAEGVSGTHAMTFTVALDESVQRRDHGRVRVAGRVGGSAERLRGRERPRDVRARADLAHPHHRDPR